MNKQESITYGGKLMSVSSSPHIKGETTSRGIMLDVIIALIPVLVFGAFVFGTRVITVTAVSVISCVLFEFLYEKVMKKPVTVGDFSAVVTGILLAFNLPAGIPFWIPVVGAFFAIVIVKQLYGGIGKNILNPALAARVFLATCWPNEMTTYVKPGSALSFFSKPVPDMIASATPLRHLKEGMLADESLLDLFIGNYAGVIGEVSTSLLVLGGVYLLVRKVITWEIPVFYIGTVALITAVFPQNPLTLQFVLSELLSGGLILAAVFMATDYATAPVTFSGRMLYGIGCGLITIFIRYFGGFAEGASYAILIMNLLVWYIDRLTKPVAFGTKNQKLNA